MRALARREFIASALLLPPAVAAAQTGSRRIPVADGWARNQINVVIFRRNSLASSGARQYIAFYDADGRVVLGRRTPGERRWELSATELTGDLRDAHNAISIAVDGAGTLHVAWNHHTSPLQYCRGVKPDSLSLTGPMPMTGSVESRVTYPEFYAMPGGDLLFFYRDGVSGDGRLVINRYDVAARKWARVQEGLLAGQGRRSAYWQAAVDRHGAVHVSWVWRETPDVRTNHDLAYAVSRDGGRTWQQTSGRPYTLPITADSAEYAARIPAGSDLINQTSMCVDHAGRPAIASYWRPAADAAPQYHLVHHDGTLWHVTPITRRTLSFSLGGGGTRRIPISRPLLLARPRANHTSLMMVYRDEERGSRITLARTDDPRARRWSFTDLTDYPVGQWEPTCDMARWQRTGALHLFVQRVGQGQAESLEDLPPQPIEVLEVDARLVG